LWRRRPAFGAGLNFSVAVVQEEARMAGVIIIREMVGTSPRSWSDAARQAVATASRTVRNIRTVEVVKSSAAVEDGQIVEYRVELKIGFEYEG
jgi:dodecin